MFSSSSFEGGVGQAKILTLIRCILSLKKALVLKQITEEFYLFVSIQHITN